MEDAAGLSGTVESEFVWRTLLGEQIVPFRVLDADQFVLPLTRKGGLLAGDNPHLDRYPGLAAWVREAEGLWATNGQSKLTLAGQIDHMRKLTQQVPVPPIRVVYAASGMHVSASLVTNSNAVVEHGAYWASVATEAEGRYLVGILNSPVLTELVRPLMSYARMSATSTSTSGDSRYRRMTPRTTTTVRLAGSPGSWPPRWQS